MKNTYKLTLIFFVVGMLIGGLFVLSRYSFENGKLANETSSALINIAKSKTDKINLYLFSVEEDIHTLQISEEVKKLLRQEPVFDVSVIKLDVDERARVISKEAENYLKAHPEMTLKDLQESKHFQDIVVQPVSKTFQDIIVQPVGKEGYSFAFDSQSLINYFHKEPRRIGYDYNTMKNTFPMLWKMFKETSEKGLAEGLYYRDEPDGSVSYKYGKFVQIPVKTADGVSMSLGATAYVNDYKIVKEKSENLENFRKDSDYYNLVVLSTEGHIIYMVEPMEDIGTSLEWEVNLEEGLSKNYFKVKENKEVSFYGPFVSVHGDIFPKISIMAPIFDERNLLGYVALVDEMDSVFDITKETIGLGETGETYLVDSEKILISPLRHRDLDILVQSVETENTDECLEEEGIEHVGEFLNYRGKRVFGVHGHIVKANWCLLAEISQDEVDVSVAQLLKNNLLVAMAIILTTSFAGLIIGKYSNRMTGEFKSLKNLKLRYSILFAFVIATGYYFLINLFFDKIIYPIFVSGLLSFVVGTIMFFYGAKLKYTKSRKYLFLGAGAIVLYHLAHIPMEQHFNLVKPFNVLYWAPLLVLYAFGFLFLLKFLEDSAK